MSKRKPKDVKLSSPLAANNATLEVDYVSCAAGSRAVGVT
jgi:hypothetical protein